MKIYLFPNWLTKKGQFELGRELTREQRIAMLKMFAMWFVFFAYAIVALEVDTYYVRGSIITFIFAALWLPLRWDRHMPSEARKESWADKNVIHS